jgi:starch synthase
MRIIHVSAECVPAAKVGGLADVVGALPKYQNDLNHQAAVIIPKYGIDWFAGQEYEEVFSGTFLLGDILNTYKIERVKNHDLGFEFFVADLPGLFDRNGVYADPPGHFFWDMAERNTSFQRVVLSWICSLEKLPDVIHCHDHHTGFIPFMMKYGFEFERLKSITSVFTIHNGRYSGAMGWDKFFAIPAFEDGKSGLLDWNHELNPVASAVRCADKVTTVSPAYLEELKSDPGLGSLIKHESVKCSGILNGIDSVLWDPKSDVLLEHHLNKHISAFKKKNKKAICEHFNFDFSKPLITFIGRFAHEKGAYILPQSIRSFFYLGNDANFFILGSGDQQVSNEVEVLKSEFYGVVQNWNGYNEPLAHTLYAGSDFIVMPSEVEPCGLNQMYAMRYGTVPIVRKVGGLSDTVIDIEEQDGRGIVFYEVNVPEVVNAFHRAIHFFADKKAYQTISRRIYKLDFSWIKSAQQYVDLYQSI